VIGVTEALVVATRVVIVGLDGEDIEYDEERGRRVGPCPVCYARLRLRMGPQEATAEAAAIEFPVGCDMDAGALPRKANGSLRRLDQYPARHVGCFEGVVVRSTQGLAWSQAPAYKDLGLYWSR
jgi:hypothetical protein